MSKSEESLNRNELENDLMAKKRKKEKRVMFWLIVIVGLIYGALFGYFVGRFIYDGKIALFLLLFTILGMLIGIGFALSMKKW